MTGPEELPENPPEETPETEERTPDAYTAAEAARVLGVSERRVRQLADEGRLLTLETEGPLRLPQQAVHEERERRRRSGTRSSSAAAELGGGEIDVEELVARTVRAIVPLVIEPARRAEEAALEQLVEERAARMTAEQRATELELRARLAEERLHQVEQARQAAEEQAEAARRAAEARPRRSWWGRT